MKLDIEPASCQPTSVQKPSSKGVECNKIVNDTESPDEKLEKGDERDVNCVAPQVNRDRLWNVSEFDCSTSDDSTNPNEDEARDFGEPYNHSSAGTRVYEKDMVQSVMECELPEIIVCYKESHDNVIKDICIDQGVTSLGEILFGIGVDEGKALHKFLALEEEKTTGLVKPAADKDCSNDSAAQCTSVDPDQIDLCHNNVPEATEEKEEHEHEHEHLQTKDFIPELSADRETGVNKPSVQITCEEAATSKNRDTVSTVSAASAEESNSMVEGFKFDPSVPVASGKEESSKNDNFVPLVAQDMSKLEDETFSDQARHSPGESSFSMTGPITGLITYSGQIACAGSCSMRSDSSTTSTRSFAFPVLQAEWNSSPVRMRKAERRHKGCWKDGLLCCRF